MTPLKAVAAFTLGFALLVGTGLALATTEFAQAPAHDGYGVSANAASSTHGGSSHSGSTHSGSTHSGSTHSGHMGDERLDRDARGNGRDGLVTSSLRPVPAVHP